MILTCPECATSYFVDDTRIPTGGRNVKCSNCGARWQVVRDDAPPPAPVASVDADTRSEVEAEIDADFAAIEASDPREVAEPQPEKSVDQLRAEAAAEAEEARLARARARRKPIPAAPTRNVAAAKAIALAVAIVATASVIAAGIGLREKVVAKWPAAAGLYAAVGLSVNDLGLVIEQVKAAPTFQGGHPVLTVTGAIRNLRKTEAEAPALEVSLLDKAGKPLALKIAHPIDKTIPGLQLRHFALSLVDPPADLHDLEVRFQDGGDHAPAPVKAHASGHTPEAGHDAPAAEHPAEAHPAPAAEDHHG